MQKKKRKSVLVVLVALMLSVYTLSGCGKDATSTAQQTTQQTAQQTTQGGVIYLRVNPEIAIFYDAAGVVTNIEGRNTEGKQIVSDYADYKGKNVRDVMTDLVAEIGQEGYFVDDIEGQGNNITIEMEAGSQMPYDAFLDEVIFDVQEYVNANNWHSSVIAIDDIYDDVHDDQYDAYDDQYDDKYDRYDGKDDVYDDKYDQYDDQDDIYDDRYDVNDPYDDADDAYDD